MNVPNKIPPRPNDAGEPFPAVLYDDREIAAFVEVYATYEVDPEFVEETFRGCHAILKTMPLASLKEGGRDVNLQSPANERKYMKMPIETMPPLLVENGEVRDGNHRFRGLEKQGYTHACGLRCRRGRSARRGRTAYAMESSEMTLDEYQKGQLKLWEAQRAWDAMIWQSTLACRGCSGPRFLPRPASTISRSPVSKDIGRRLYRPRKGASNET